MTVVYWLFCRSWSLTKPFWNLWLEFWEAWELAPPILSLNWLRESYEVRQVEMSILPWAQAGWRMCLHVCSQGSLLMLLHEIRWTSLPCSWQGWTSTSPWHRNNPQMMQNWPNANVLEECKSQSRKGKELGSVYPSKLSVSVSCSSSDAWSLLIVSGMKQSPPSKPAPPHLPTSILAVLNLET